MAQTAKGHGVSTQLGARSVTEQGAANVRVVAAELARPGEGHGPDLVVVVVGVDLGRLLDPHRLVLLLGRLGDRVGAHVLGARVVALLAAVALARGGRRLVLARGRGARGAVAVLVPVALAVPVPARVALALLVAAAAAAALVLGVL